MPVAVLGNKVDLRNEADDCVTHSEGLEYAENLKKELQFNCEIPYLETSAKTGENVDESFSMLAYNIRQFLMQLK
jgi:GTPase SAR1 family protein